jgi:peptide/nickel transport system permease protein
LLSYGYTVQTTTIPTVSERTGSLSILSPLVIESGQLTLTDSIGEVTVYTLHEDFSILSVDESIIGPDPEAVINISGMTTEAAGEGAFYINRNFSGLGVSMYNTPNQRVTGAEHKLSFVMSDQYQRSYNTYLFTATVIIPFESLKTALESGPVFAQLSLSNPIPPQYPLRNISATLPGRDKTIDDPGEVIIIGSGYDGVYSIDSHHSHVMTAAPAAIMLETARVISNLEEPLDKTVRFMFWDNEFENIIYSPLSGSYHYGMTDKTPIMMANTHGYYYFDISYPGFSEEKYLNLVSYPAQRADKSNYLLGLEIEKRLKAMNVRYMRFRYNLRTTNALRHMRLNALTSVGIGNNMTTGINTIYDSFDNIDHERFMSIGQALVDSLTMNPYIME